MTDLDIPVMSIVDRAPSHFRFLTADEWGMTWTNPARTEKLNDPEAYVHMTGGSRMYTDAIKAFQALNRWAQEGKDFSALDYDILVHRDVVSGLMTIGAGRGEWMSAATKDRNELGEAVCLFGQFHPGERGAEQPHPDELEAIAFAIVWGIEKGWIAWDASILGHRDNPAHPGATACPGDYLYAHLPWIRQRVLELLTPEPALEEDTMFVVRPPAVYAGFPFIACGPSGGRYAVDRDVVRVRGTDDLYTEIPSRYANLFRSIYGDAPEAFEMRDGFLVKR